MARAVLRPKCWSGKNSTRLRRCEGPIEHGPGVGRRADDAAVPAAKRLQAGRRVDVGDRRQVVGVDHLAELLPAVFDLFDLGHVGQRAAGGHVGQDHRDALAAALGQPLGPIGQDVGRFGHEVDAAEGDRPALFVLARPVRPACSCRREGPPGRSPRPAGSDGRGSAAAGPSRPAPAGCARRARRFPATCSGANSKAGAAQEAVLMRIVLSMNYTASAEPRMTGFASGGTP